MTNEGELQAAKRALRKRMLALRLVVDQKEGPEASSALIKTFLPLTEVIGATPGAVVAGTWQLGTEIDVRPLMARLDAAGVTTSLPVVDAEGAPLLFRRWRPTDPVVEGDRGTFEPEAGAVTVIPDIVLVPFLAADRHGHRLGRGGGFYDRTLAKLREQGAVTAVGIGFAIQLIDNVPHGSDDHPLDWVITDREVVRIGYPDTTVAAPNPAESA